jgi:hypothetical protein
LQRTRASHRVIAAAAAHEFLIEQGTRHRLAGLNTARNPTKERQKHMTTLAITEVEEGSDASTVCWGAVIAGGIASAALTLLLFAFGAGVGFSVISPWAGEGVSTTTFHIGSGLFVVAVAIMASTVAGYLAGRLRVRWPNVNTKEVFFRDTAHGFLAWCVGTLLSAAVLGTATTHIIAGASAGSIPAAAAGTAQAASSMTDPYVDTLLRTDPATSTGGATPLGQNAPAPTANATDPSQTRSEVTRIMGASVRKGGEISAADRTYLSKVVAARTGLSPAEAEKRVNDAIVQAKQAADEARKTAAKIALWMAAAMLAGAFAAALAATEGGHLRDSRWYEPGWRLREARN